MGLVIYFSFEMYKNISISNYYELFAVLFPLKKGFEKNNSMMKLF